MKDPKERFSATAELYSRYRPGYPGALLDWIIAQADLKPGDPVADVGCGTGISSRALAARGLKVTGVDPNESMLAHAQAQSAPGVRYVKAAAEATGLTGQSFAAVTVAQAFHWFDIAATLAEFNRILRPGGRCFAFWNLRAVTPQNREYEELLHRFSAEYREVGQDFGEHTAGSRTERSIREDSRVYDWHKAEFTDDHVLDWQGFWGRVQSSSYIQHGVEDPAGLEAAMSDFFRRHSVADSISVAYRTEVWGFCLKG